MIKTPWVLHYRIAIEELEEEGIINQFDEMNSDIMNKIIIRANEIANEDEE